MPILTQLTPADADEIIKEESRLIVRTHDANHAVEDFMSEFVRSLTEEFHRADLAPVLEIILRELMTNAAKANFKKIFFAENGLLLEDPVQYQAGVVKFRQIFSEDMFAQYGQKAREARLDITTIIDFNADRFVIEIRNNVPMSSVEERRVREKLSMAMSACHAGQFIMDNVDETEGAGLGIMLCISALRSISVDPRYFSVATDHLSQTVARLEIPLHSNYVPARGRWAAAVSS